MFHLSLKSYNSTGTNLFFVQLLKRVSLVLYFGRKEIQVAAVACNIVREDPFLYKKNQIAHNSSD